MKIAIILSGNTVKAPYLSYYLKFLEDYKIQYDIICWNRRMIDESGNLSYNVSQTEGIGYFNRFYSYLGYKKFVINCLNKNKYDKIIVSTIAIAILLYPYLKKYYRKKYLFDIRDYSLIVKFSWLVLKKVVDNSAATVISSPGFTEWLPRSSKYYIAHNFPFELTNGDVKIISEDQSIKQNNKPIEIATIGSLRDYEANKIIIDSLKKSDQFKLDFIGTGPAYQPLKNYVLNNEVSNAFFYGFYQKKDEADLLYSSDFINNFTNSDLNSRTLVTNRFYLSVVLGIPMIVRYGTYQAELCERYKLGYVLNSHIEIESQLKRYIMSYNQHEYANGRTDFLEVVEDDTRKLEILFRDFVLKC